MHGNGMGSFEIVHCHLKRVTYIMALFEVGFNLHGNDFCICCDVFLENIISVLIFFFKLNIIIDVTIQADMYNDLETVHVNRADLMLPLRSA